MWRELEKHVVTRRKIRVEFHDRSEEGSLLNGYVIGCSRMLCLMHPFDDFEPDGYTIFRIEDVSSIRSNEFERHWDHMLARERLLDGLNFELKIDLDNMHSALHSLFQQANRLSFEYESDDPEAVNFVIGELVELTDSIASVNHFDGLGKWTTEPERIEIERINQIEFLTPYIETFWKYTHRPEY